MAKQLTEDRIKRDLVFYGQKILANLFNDCFPQLRDVFSEESIKHHLFHCRFKYSTTNRCHIIQCERERKHKHVNDLHDIDFQKIYQKKDTNPCIQNCCSCIEEWEPRKDVNIDNLDYDAFKRLFECKYVRDNKDFQKCKTSFDYIFEFRNAFSHNRPMKDFRNSLLKAASLVKNKEEQSSIYRNVEELFHELAGTLEIRICNETANRRKSFLNGMLLNVPASVKEKQQFAYNNLGFYFEDDSLSTKDPDLKQYIHEHQECLDNMNKSWLSHTLCYFGIDNLLKELLNEPQLLPLINNVDYKNQNILMNACEQNHWSLAKDLLRKFTQKWNLYQRDCNGKTALIMCLKNKEMIKLFIELELNIIELTGFSDQHDLPIDIAKLKLDDQQKEVKNQQTSVQGEAWIALSFENNKTLPTLLKSLDRNKWKEKDFLNADNCQIQLLLKCDSIDKLKLEAKPLNADSKYNLGKQRWDEPIDCKYVLQCKIGDTMYTGFKINKHFEPVLVFPCEDDYRQEYILTNVSSTDEHEIFGNIEKMDEDCCITFKPQNDFLTLQCFYVTKRPKRRQYVLEPIRENIILLDCGGNITFPEGCIEQPHTVEIWEKRMEPPTKDSKIKAGTDMVYVHSKRPMKLLEFVKFEFSGPCQPLIEPHLKPKLLKVSTTESSEYHIKVCEDKVNFDPERNTIDFTVKELCGKCVVFCEKEQILDEILAMEVKLLYLNYKRCTAWFGLEKITNGMTTAHVLVLMNNEDLSNEQKMQFEAYQKKEDLIIRDFCTFHIRCAGSFACKDQPSLHVQFFSKKNSMVFKIEVRRNIKLGTFEVEGLPDINKFEVHFTEVERLIDREKDEGHAGKGLDFPQLQDQPTKDEYKEHPVEEVEEAVLGAKAVDEMPGTSLRPTALQH